MITFVAAISLISIASAYISPVKFPHHELNLFRVRGGSQLGATATEEQVKSGLGWDSHQAVDSIPETLVKSIEGNGSMRRKFETLCREAQVRLNIGCWM